MSLLSKSRYFISVLYPDTEIIYTARAVQMGCVLGGPHSGDGSGAAGRKPSGWPASRGPVTYASFPVHQQKTGNKNPHLPKRASFHKLKISLSESKSCYLVTARMKGYGSIVLRPKLVFPTWLTPNPEGLLLAWPASLHHVEERYRSGAGSSLHSKWRY